MSAPTAQAAPSTSSLAFQPDIPPLQRSASAPPSSVPLTPSKSNSSTYSSRSGSSLPKPGSPYTSRLVKTLSEYAAAKGVDPSSLSPRHSLTIPKTASETSQEESPSSPNHLSGAMGKSRARPHSSLKTHTRPRTFPYLPPSDATLPLNLQDRGNSSPQLSANLATLPESCTDESESSADEERLRGKTVRSTKRSSRVVIERNCGSASVATDSTSSIRQLDGAAAKPAVSEPRVTPYGPSSSATSTTVSLRLDPLRTSHARVEDVVRSAENPPEGSRQAASDTKPITGLKKLALASSATVTTLHPKIDASEAPSSVLPADAASVINISVWRNSLSFDPLPPPRLPSKSVPSKGLPSKSVPLPPPKPSRTALINLSLLPMAPPPLCPESFLVDPFPENYIALVKSRSSPGNVTKSHPGSRRGSASSRRGSATSSKDATAGEKVSPRKDSNPTDATSLDSGVLFPSRVGSVGFDGLLKTAVKPRKVSCAPWEEVSSEEDDLDRMIAAQRHRTRNAEEREMRRLSIAASLRPSIFSADIAHCDKSLPPCPSELAVSAAQLFTLAESNDVALPLFSNTRTSRHSIAFSERSGHSIYIDAPEDTIAYDSDDIEAIEAEVRATLPRSERPYFFRTLQISPWVEEEQSHSLDVYGDKMSMIGEESEEEEDEAYRSFDSDAPTSPSEALSSPSPRLNNGSSRFNIKGLFISSSSSASTPSLSPASEASSRSDYSPVLPMTPTTITPFSIMEQFDSATATTFSRCSMPQFSPSLRSNLSSRLSGIIRKTSSTMPFVTSIRSRGSTEDLGISSSDFRMEEQVLEPVWRRASASAIGGETPAEVYRRQIRGGNASEGRGAHDSSEVEAFVGSLDQFMVEEKSRLRGMISTRRTSLP
ncbi:hypothetical protein P7C70_g3479, partial [Phenoliferia sp. Uapishka_3]